MNRYLLFIEPFIRSVFTIGYTCVIFDISWVIFYLTIITNDTNSKFEIGCIEVETVRVIVKVCFYALSYERVFSLCQSNHFTGCVTESNNYDKQSEKSSDESPYLRFSTNIECRYFLAKRVKTNNEFLSIPCAISAHTIALALGSSICHSWHL